MYQHLKEKVPTNMWVRWMFPMNNMQVVPEQQEELGFDTEIDHQPEV